MFKTIWRLMDHWSGWIGDRDLENAVRSELSRRGWQGASAKFTQFRLVAIRRPGWLQVFKFEVTWDLDPCAATQPSSVYGLVRQDERYNKLEIELFESISSQNIQFQQWSEGLHRLRGD